MAKKRTVNELTRLAFIYAELDRDSMAKCCQPGDEYGQRQAQLAKEFREYRIKRWGKTQLEVDLENADTFYVLGRKK